MCKTAIGLQTIWSHWLVIAKLTYACSQLVLGEDSSKLLAGYELTLSITRLNTAYYTVHLPMFEQLCDNIDDQPFNKIIANSNGVLHTIGPYPLTTIHSVLYIFSSDYFICVCMGVYVYVWYAAVGSINHHDDDDHHHHHVFHATC